MLKQKTWFKVLCTVLLCLTLLLTLGSGLFLEMDERNNWNDGFYTFAQSNLAGTWMEKRLGRLSSRVVDAICEGEPLNQITMSQGMGFRLENVSGEILADTTTDDYDFVSAVTLYLNTQYNRNSAVFSEESNLTPDSEGTARLTLKGYIRTPVRKGDAAYWIDRIYQLMGQRNYFVITLAVSGILSVILFLFLMSAAGHSEDVEGIDQRGWHRIPFDLLTACVGGLLILDYIAYDMLSTSSRVESTEVQIVIVIAAVVAAILLLLLLVTSLAVRVKAGNLLKGTFIYMFFSAVDKGLRGVPVLWKGLLLFLVTAGLNFFAGFRKDLLTGIIIAALDAVALIAIGVVGYQLGELKRAGQELAAGNLGYVVDTRPLTRGLKEHGENLNQVGLNIQSAVAEQLKSDRFKTELITNVSHDLRTPLTNIINYVDLLKKEPIDDPAAQEYITVLETQSHKLKKLTDDLIDASKASSGVIELNTEPIDLSEFVSQICGEYQERFAAANLSLLQQNPPEPIIAMADGGQLSRVLENLLQNAIKYSLTGTRVYLSLSKDSNYAYLELKNISRDQLGISTEELKERFVRGDTSRSTEGSGLGLSIAQSLTELMGGTLSIALDGDLFKVAVCLLLAPPVSFPEEPVL